MLCLRCDEQERSKYKETKWNKVVGGSYEAAAAAAPTFALLIMIAGTDSVGGINLL